MNKNTLFITVAFAIGTLLLACETTPADRHILRANFDQDQIGEPPQTDLPGAPINDQIDYNPALRNRAEVVDWNGNKALKIKHVPPTSEISKTDWGFSFVSQHASLQDNFIIKWRGRANFQGGSSVFSMQILSFSNDNLIPLSITAEGKLYARMDDWATDKHLGDINLNEKHLFIIEVNKSTGTYNLTVGQRGKGISHKNLEMVRPKQALNNHPEVRLSFGFPVSINTSNMHYIIDDIEAYNIYN